ncbi:MAG TPA: histidine ammonia-lyase [Casimicrobiaceae bacterium]|jgi:histidine ammonia-lyase|nr:histidine ammonia-lyase [Casimicrobiaceae bacterium]
MTALHLLPGRLTLDLLRSVWTHPVAVTLDGDARARIDAAADTVAGVIAEGRIVYGVNTGFGLLARTHIDATRLAELQRALVLSHSAGTGPPLDDAVVRLTLLLKIASLSRGYSGVRYEVIDALLKLLNTGVVPVVPSQGSVGASGDLAPLAHLAGVLIGEGEARVDGTTMPASQALTHAGITPLRLAAKEGLALVNGTQVSTALSLAGLFAGERMFAAGLVAGALSVDACLGSDTPFDERIQALRGHRGQADAARVLRELLAGSAIRASHRDCPRVQDPYSLRCQPQVMGACLDQMRRAAEVLLIEADAVSDNPLVFPETREVLSGGNFHGEPVALAADGLALAIAEIGAMSERRTALLMDANLSGLPSFLVRDGGVNSGFMIAQVTAAALASENKALAVPRSVDSLPTSANQEDHVSMATNAALRLAPMAGNTAAIVAIELLAAAQGVELRAPLATSPRLQAALQLIRSVAAFWDRDRAFAPDLARVRALVERGEFTPFVGAML